MAKRIERALISVSDKRGVEPFARALHQLDVELLATGGTRRLLQAAGIPVREVSEVTDFPEMMDGRIKTLHPRVHGGILALRDEASHASAMKEHAIPAIDLVCVNLYPFETTVARPDVTRAEAIEEIDIGGPTMVRSAAKNHRFVTVVTDPDDYERVIDALKEGAGTASEGLRRELALKAFLATARYDAAISHWLFEQEQADGNTVEEHPPSYVLAGTRIGGQLRYGENPHQSAAFYRSSGCSEPSVVGAEFLGGKELSYNNLVDLDAALALAKEFDEPFACVIKHTNPCGAAVASELAQALEQAWSGDPLSAFGSVLAFSRPLDVASAEFLVSGGRFVEAIVAPAFDPKALELLRSKPKWGKNVRLLACGAFDPSVRASAEFELKRLIGGFLLQSRDLHAAVSGDFDCVTKKQPSASERDSLVFANKIGKHVKSNAIVLASGTRVLGVGAGQMSRVDSVKLAIEKAAHEVRGCVLASDAFFPFPDGVETAIAAGVTAIIQPGGSMRDKAVIETCDERGAAMVFTAKRHFRH